MSLLCLHPVTCWRIGTAKTKDGIRSPKITFSEKEALAYALSHRLDVSKLQMSVPCGHCDACQLNRKRDWVTKISQEMSCFQDCCFLTLTYDDEHIPTKNVPRGTLPTLRVSDVQKFMKRLRRHLEYVPKFKKGVHDHVDKPIRYFLVGEYGPSTHRPHYHVLVFGWKPSDMREFFQHKGKPVSRSDQVEKLWTLGYSTVQCVTVGVAKYVAQYVTKKLTKDSYESDNGLVPTFFRYSTRGGGIGTTWLKRWYRSVLDKPYVTYRAGDLIVKAHIPQSYKHWIRKHHVDVYLDWRDKAVAYMRENPRVLTLSDYEKNQSKIGCLLHKSKEDDKLRPV